MLKAMHTDHLDWSLPAHRRGTLRGMDAAVRAYTDVLAACPAMVGGQGPCGQATDQPLHNRCIPHRSIT
ncbi:hypothetical protein XhhCFBP4925_02190 [Xanthomonas hortorum pv. hederae]|nr:hypothetical protein XhhCFBP4925_02190 [Xanthomonas hortorum pv. hederae]